MQKFWALHRTDNEIPADAHIGGDVRLDHPFMMNTLSDTVRVAVTARPSPTTHVWQLGAV
jgi:hypothetical protein